jgi:hypothetical protein
MNVSRHISHPNKPTSFMNVYEVGLMGSDVCLKSFIPEVGLLMFDMSL